MFLFFLNLIFSVFILVRVMQVKVARERGTNTVTRFIRDGTGHAFNNMYILMSAGITVGCLLLGAIFDCIYACLPSAALIVFIFVQQFKSNHSEQRVKDSRVVTKGTGKVVAATIDPVATSATFVATGGNVAAAQAAHVAASSASKIIDKSMDKMTDVDSITVEQAEFKELNAYTKHISGIDIEHPEAFIEAAKRAGIETNGKDLGEVASNVIKFAPPAMLAELPENISDEEKAMRIMGGQVG